MDENKKTRENVVRIGAKEFRQILWKKENQEKMQLNRLNRVNSLQNMERGVEVMQELLYCERRRLKAILQEYEGIFQKTTCRRSN